MTTKSFDKKAAQRFIVESRENGKTDQEIYNELIQQNNDKRTVALLITGTVTKENKQKYKRYNNILLGLLALSILFKLLSVLSLTIQTGEPFTLILLLIVPLFDSYLMYEIAKYEPRFYSICGWLAVVSFFITIGNAATGTDILINIIFNGTLAVVSFYLYYKMFPNYSPKHLKQDNGGAYVFN